MKAAWLNIWLLACLPAWSGEPGDWITVRSRAGGQFIVHGQQQKFGKSLATSASVTTQPVRLDPSLLAISCDRIKRAFLRELGCADQWRGKIHVFIQSSAPRNGPVTVDSAFYLDAWQGRITLPPEIEAPRLIRTILQALLLEMANRVPGVYTDEIPLWVVEGVTQLVFSQYGSSLVLEGQTRSIRMEMRTDPLIGIRARLHENGALSFGELGLPTAEQLSGDPWLRFRDSACAFTSELLRLPGGQTAFVQFLGQLPRHLNWQTAFFSVYGDRFPNPLAVEKWWALTVANVAGRDLGQTWPLETSLRKLEELLSIPVSVRESSDRLPQSSSQSIQEFINQWGWEAQEAVLPGKIGLLRLLYLQSSPSIAPLIQGYLATLTSYWDKHRDQPEPLAGKGSGTGSHQLWAQVAIKRLDVLDQQLQGWLRQIPGSEPSESPATIPAVPQFSP